MHLRRLLLKVLAAGSGMLALASALTAAEPIKPGTPVGSLHVGQTSYENVVVRSVNARTVVITHAGGLTSVRLRDLSPEWQARFNYDPAADAAAEIATAPKAAPKTATALVRARASTAKDTDFENLLQRFGQPAPLQTEVNLRPRFGELGIGVRNQGRQPSCSIYAVVSALEFQSARNSGKAENFSEDYLIWATQKTIQRTPANISGLPEASAEDADAGFSLMEVVTALRTYGIPAQSSLPGNFGASSEALRGPPPEVIKEAREHQRVFVHPLPGRDRATRINNLIHALNAGMPVAIGLAWPNFRALRTGYLSAQQPMQNAWHAVTIVGYHSKSGLIEDTYFIFKNSWGSTWGQGGYGTVTYGYLDKNLADAVLLEIQES